MSRGDQAQGGQAEEQRLYDEAQESRHRHRRTRRHEDAPDHRGQQRGADTEADLREHRVSGLEAPVTEGAEGTQLKEEGQCQVGSLKQSQHVYAPSARAVPGRRLLAPPTGLLAVFPRGGFAAGEEESVCATCGEHVEGDGGGPGLLFGAERLTAERLEVLCEASL